MAMGAADASRVPTGQLPVHGTNRPTVKFFFAAAEHSLAENARNNRRIPYNGFLQISNSILNADAFVKEALRAS